MNKRDGISLLSPNLIKVEENGNEILLNISRHSQSNDIFLTGDGAQGDGCGRVRHLDRTRIRDSKEFICDSVGDLVTNSSPESLDDPSLSFVLFVSLPLRLCVHT